MIWASVDQDVSFEKGVLPYPTVKDLQDRIRRQAKRARLQIEDKEDYPGLELIPLNDRIAAGNWAYTSLDLTIYTSSFFGD